MLNVKTVLFQTFHFSLSTLFNSFWIIGWKLSTAVTLGQRGQGSNDNEGVFYIPQNSSITETPPSDCLGSYLGHSFVACGGYKSSGQIVGGQKKMTSILKLHIEIYLLTQLLYLTWNVILIVQFNNYSYQLFYCLIW